MDWYIIKLEHSAKYVGAFATKEMAMQWIKQNGLDKGKFEIIKLIPKGEYQSR